MLHFLSHKTVAGIILYFKIYFPYADLSKLRELIIISDIPYLNITEKINNIVGDQKIINFYLLALFIIF